MPDVTPSPTSTQGKKRAPEAETAEGEVKPDTKKAANNHVLNLKSIF
jgi:hypothetical protein